MIREFADSLLARLGQRRVCSQLHPLPEQRGTFLQLERCKGVAVTMTPASLGDAHPRPLCASCALGLAYVLEHNTVYARIVEAAGYEPQKLAGELRGAAERGIS